MVEKENGEESDNELTEGKAKKGEFDLVKDRLCQ